ncbi:hypothetical protein [Halomicrobium salinisoli]|uniref:hypothetical protein n=1 Tax=Halomicrobium salinisoli TaxID=2878391 RepID=UPI001CF00EAA|nr:hypothetical protein [Halomicrobium salinisoli]
MTATTSRPPATPRGRNWHVRAYQRAVSGVLFAVTICFAVVYRNWPMVYREWAEMVGVNIFTSPMLGHPVEPALHGPFTFHPDAPLPVAFLEFLVARLTFWPVLALLVGGLVCTVALEIRERERHREP